MTSKVLYIHTTLPRTSDYHTKKVAQTVTMAAFLVAAVVVASALLQSAAAQTTYIVGDTMGWTMPSDVRTDDYPSWASRHNFIVGDILFFSFTTGRHDVAKVTKDNFDACNGHSPISLVSTGPANITLDSAGDNYFICTFNGHCSSGQMLAIKVVIRSTTTTSPPPADTPPPPSSAPSAGGGATFFIMFMLIFINFFMV